MALEHIDPYPWFLNKVLELTVNERMVRTRINSTEWADAWRPFLAKLYDLWTAHYPNRFLLGIAGPPGAGKSVFAEVLHFIIDKGFLHKDAHVIALPMDGFHYPNTYLDTHTRRLSDGTEIPLSSVKGQPDTMDVHRLRRYMNALVKRPEYIPWPGYSRAAHDVQPGKYHVHMSMNLVLIEGNYLLVNRGAFAGLPEMFHLRVYIDAPAPKIIANLVERHIQGGKTIDEAKDWVKRIDLPNARIAESSKANADVVIERDSDNDIAAVFWSGQELTPRPAAPLPFAVEHVPLPVHDVPHGQGDVQHGQGDARPMPVVPAATPGAPDAVSAVISAASAESSPTDAGPGQT